jgi:cyclopropane fatty-acyl-phospholipid synthase-like methyltransferase
MKKSTDVIEIYDAEYFLNQVDGCKEFAEFDGTFEALFPRYKRNIELLDLRPEHNFLEMGCGRGEVCIYHALSGGRAKGVDYSSDAIQLAKKKASSLGLTPEFQNSSFDQLKISYNEYDRILASEFIEHISRSEGLIFFKSAYSLLKPNGQLLVYTMPNTLYRRYGYPIFRLLNALRGRFLPKTMEDMSSEHYKLYHLNEQNYFSLVSFAKQAGFKKFVVAYDVKGGSGDGPLSLKSLFKYIISRTPLRHILLNNLYILAKK